MNDSCEINVKIITYNKKVLELSREYKLGINGNEITYFLKYDEMYTTYVKARQQRGYTDKILDVKGTRKYTYNNVDGRKNKRKHKYA